MDSTLAVVDSFQMKNGYLTDFHDFILLPNGHAMLMSYHNVTMDMSLIVPGGKPDATIVINIFQEQDAMKNVVFEWRDIDYIPITDTDLKLTDPRINPGTMNAFELDHDGNLLFSFRNHSDIVKISRETGEIIWRLGGSKNEFTFIGEHPENAPYYFSRQHDIHRLPNGNISLFDNGEFHTPWYSRAAEYRLNEITKTAELISEYRYPTGNIMTQAAGNAHRIPSGGWFVGYGILSPASPVKRNIVESHADGSTAFELSLPANVSSYRTSKQAWRQFVQKVQVSHAEVLQGNTYLFNKDGKTTGISVTFQQLAGDIYNNVTVTRIPFGPVKPEFIADAPVIYPASFLYEGASISSHVSGVKIHLSAYPEIHRPKQTAVYMREFAGQGLFVELPVTYDSAANTLSVSTTKFGEFIFGEKDARRGMASPVLVEPVNKRKVSAAFPVELRWSGRGMFRTFHLQIANDSMFSSILFDTLTEQSSHIIEGLQKMNRYYWRVRSASGSVYSPWSSIWNFQPVDPFITLLSPNGSEKLQLGTQTIVRWETNILDSVQVKLLRSPSSLTLVGKANGANSALLWNISSSLTADSSYRLIIVSLADTTMADTSNAPFTLTTVSSVENKKSSQPNGFALYQNYPNPFNPETTVRFDLPEDMYVSLAVYDLLGTRVKNLVERRMTAGVHHVSFNASDLPSGIYFYRLNAGVKSFTKKMMYIK